MYVCIRRDTEYIISISGLLLVLHGSAATLVRPHGVPEEKHLDEIIVPNILKEPEIKKKKNMLNATVPAMPVMLGDAWSSSTTKRCSSTL